MEHEGGGAVPPPEGKGPEMAQEPEAEIKITVTDGVRDGIERLLGTTTCPRCEDLLADHEWFVVQGTGKRAQIVRCDLDD